MKRPMLQRKPVILLILSIVAAGVLFFCVQREDEIGSRSNPFDAGGTDWDSTSPPEVTLSGGDLWVEYDHATGKGGVGLTIAVADENFPFDTVSGQLRMADQAPVSLRFNDSLSTTTFVVSGMLPETTRRCTVYVADLKDAADTAYLPT